MKNNKPVTVESPAKVEVLADSLQAMADNVRELSSIGRQIASSKLKKRAILILLKDMTHISMGDIDKILTALPQLEKEYLK